MSQQLLVALDPAALCSSEALATVAWPVWHAAWSWGHHCSTLLAAGLARWDRCCAGRCYAVLGGARGAVIAGQYQGCTSVASVNGTRHSMHACRTSHVFQPQRTIL
jgi:hypothetical protein